MTIELYCSTGLYATYIECELLTHSPTVYYDNTQPRSLHFKGLRKEGSRIKVEKETISTTLRFVITY